MNGMDAGIAFAVLVLSVRLNNCMRLPFSSNKLIADINTGLAAAVLAYFFNSKMLSSIISGEIMPILFCSFCLTAPFKTFFDDSDKLLYASVCVSNNMDR